MPMLHGPDQQSEGLNQCWSRPDPDMIERRVSEESIRTEFCEGPIPDDVEELSPEIESTEREAGLGVETSDRQDLIERLKRGESPTWVPNRKLQDCISANLSTQQSPIPGVTSNEVPLLPAFEFREKPISSSAELLIEESREVELGLPSEIERPRSALHTGDFTKDIEHLQDQKSYFSSTTSFHDVPSGDPLVSCPTTPWFKPTIRNQGTPQNDAPSGILAHGVPIDIARRPSRSRAPSLQSYSSSFVLKSPTSPLVQQSNNEDLDFSPVDLSKSPSRVNRRFTLPPHGFHALGPLANDSSPGPSAAAHQPPSLRKEETYPHQKHFPRRSLTSSWSFQTASSPQTPAYLRSRRPSFSSEASPLQHAAMVGSYEESILRGRMSTGPSKPLDFTAQIGVLGKGDCKPKYPAHVTIPFPAVYYNWNNGIGHNPSMVDDEPSPYVGHIDLEHSLPPAKIKESRRRHRGSSRTRESDAAGVESTHEQDCAAMNLKLRKREKQRRRSPSPKAPIGGSYRIPQQGQLQIMIKNPNKTAVKLFLVPYDLSGMEAGTKTFIRQRCYSTGPIIEAPITSRSVSEPIIQGRPAVIDAKSKPTLRYLIHLNICCPSKGRFYLYQHIRVVFANRVPDNKEKLQNDIQLPEPRYSTYKASRESVPPVPSAGAKLTAEKAQRRRSYGFGGPLGAEGFNALSDLHGHFLGASSTNPQETSTETPPIPPMPLSLIRSKKQPKAESVVSADDPMDVDSSRPTTSSGLQSPLSDRTNRVANTLSSSYRSSASNASDSYGKLNRGDAGYGGVGGLFGRPGTPEPGEGLLARRLRELGMEKEGRRPDAGC
ncbi:hypothetical protein MMC26_007336 [Xylographa opegraphella]|nr:hypothetical protein [Xylographa opegraphella]